MLYITEGDVTRKYILLSILLGTLINNVGQNLKREPICCPNEQMKVKK